MDTMQQSYVCFIGTNIWQQSLITVGLQYLMLFLLYP